MWELWNSCCGGDGTQERRRTPSGSNQDGTLLVPSGACARTSKSRMGSQSERGLQDRNADTRGQRLADAASGSRPARAARMLLSSSKSESSTPRRVCCRDDEEAAPTGPLKCGLAPPRPLPVLALLSRGRKRGRQAMLEMILFGLPILTIGERRGRRHESRPAGCWFLETIQRMKPRFWRREAGARRAISFPDSAQ